MFYFHSLE